MAELKTKVTDASVRAFIDAVPDAQKRADTHKVAAMMRDITGDPGRMWGKSIAGYGSYTCARSTAARA